MKHLLLVTAILFVSLNANAAIISTQNIIRNGDIVTIDINLGTIPDGAVSAHLQPWFNNLDWFTGVDTNSLGNDFFFFYESSVTAYNASVEPTVAAILMLTGNQKRKFYNFPTARFSWEDTRTYTYATVVAVPVPAAAWLFASALIGLASMIRLIGIRRIKFYLT